MPKPQFGDPVHVTFQPAPESNLQRDAIAVLQLNHFLFHQLSETEFIVMTPTISFGGSQAVSDDINENAISGRFVVRPLKQSEAGQLEKKSLDFRY